MGEGFGLNEEILAQKQPKIKLVDEIIDNEDGLSQLYHTFVVQGVKLKGSGHEMSDFAKIMGSVKTWHGSFQPKLEFNYFLKRVRNADKKKINQHMGQVRQVFKGELDPHGVMVEKEKVEENHNEIDQKEPEEKFQFKMVGQIDTCNKKEVEEKFQFRMVDQIDISNNFTEE